MSLALVLSLVTSAASAKTKGNNDEFNDKSTHVQIVLFDVFDLLDALAPYEVFAAAGMYSKEPLSRFGFRRRHCAGRL